MKVYKNYTYFKKVSHKVILSLKSNDKLKHEMGISLQVMNFEYAFVGQHESLWIIDQYPDIAPLPGLNKFYLPEGSTIAKNNFFRILLLVSLVLVTHCKTVIQLW